MLNRLVKLCRPVISPCRTWVRGTANQTMAKPGAGGPHDIGGLVDDGKPLDLKEYDYKFWERQVHSLVLALVRKKLLNLDELRRGVEALSPAAMEAMTYYERWAASMTAICLERGTLTRAELDAQLGTYEEHSPEVLFKPGDLVRVKEERAAVRWRKPHLRTPGYIFGVIGTIERECQGLFGNPEHLAFREPAPKIPMYRVRFAQPDVWEGYQGPESDVIDIEIYQPWLERATKQDLDAQQKARRERQEQIYQARHDHDHDHHHDHDHAHDHDHGHIHEEGGEPHVHEERSRVEQNAVCKEEGEDGDDAERRRLADALTRALIAKGIVTADELREGVEAMDAKGQQGGGAKIVARAWVDPEFKARLMKDAGEAAAELGVSASFWPTAPAAAAAQPASIGPKPVTGTILTVVENTPQVHNLVVCTLCSCYPLSVLGMSPPWYKSRSYRSRAVRNPRAVLKEFGTELPDRVAVAVHDSTADNRYLVLPMRPEGTEGWSEEDLRKLITRDSMIGVTPALTPQQLREREARQAEREKEAAQQA